MKNNIDLFIKYLDDQMSSKDLESFEEKLRTNTELNEEFSNFRKLYLSKNNDIELEENYFITLLPKAKDKLKESKPNHKIRYALILPAIILVIFFLFNQGFNEDLNNIEKYENLWEVIAQDEELSNSIVRDAINVENDFLSDSIFISEFYNQEILLDESVFDYLENNLTLNEINNSLVDSLSENEFNNLYAKIIDKKILGMK